MDLWIATITETVDWGDRDEEMWEDGEGRMLAFESTHVVGVFSTLGRALPALYNHSSLCHHDECRSAAQWLKGNGVEVEWSWMVPCRVRGVRYDLLAQAYVLDGGAVLEWHKPLDD